MGIQVHGEWKTNGWECMAERVREGGEGSVHVHGTRRTGLLGVMGDSLQGNIWGNEREGYWKKISLMVWVIR